MGNVLTNETIGTNEMCKDSLIVPTLPQLIPVDTASQKSFLSCPCSCSPLNPPSNQISMFSVSFIIAFVSCFFFVTFPSTSPEADRLQLRFPVHCSHWVPAQKCKWSSRFYTLHCRICHEYELLLVPSLSILLQTFLCKIDNGTRYGRFALKLLSCCPGNIKNIWKYKNLARHFYVITSSLSEEYKPLGPKEVTLHCAGKQ